MCFLKKDNSHTHDIGMIRSMLLKEIRNVNSFKMWLYSTKGQRAQISLTAATIWKCHCGPKSLLKTEGRNGQNLYSQPRTIGPPGTHTKEATSWHVNIYQSPLQKKEVLKTRVVICIIERKMRKESLTGALSAQFQQGSRPLFAVTAIMS